MIYLFLLALSSCSWVPASLQDNPIEEEVEQIIQDETGVKIDFTGSSPEK